MMSGTSLLLLVVLVFVLPLGVVCALEVDVELAPEEAAAAAALVVLAFDDGVLLFLGLLLSRTSGGFCGDVEFELGGDGVVGGVVVSHRRCAIELLLANIGVTKRCHRTSATTDDTDDGVILPMSVRGRRSFDVYATTTRCILCERER